MTSQKLNKHEIRRLPTCKLSSGNVLFAPSVQELAAPLKWQRPPQRGEYDVAIYGAGPAGLSAAVHAASEGLRTILIEKSTLGGQAGSTSLIENYLGFPDGIPGWELASRARCQALRLGAEIIVGAEAIAGRKKEDITHVSLSNGTHVASLTTICACGVEYQRLWLVNEDRLLNRGLYYGAGSSARRGGTLPGACVCDWRWKQRRAGRTASGALCTSRNYACSRQTTEEYAFGVPC